MEGEEIKELPEDHFCSCGLRLVGNYVPTAKIATIKSDGYVIRCHCGQWYSIEKKSLNIGIINELFLMKFN
jgi:hypothetical protein